MSLWFIISPSWPQYLPSTVNHSIFLPLLQQNWESIASCHIFLFALTHSWSHSDFPWNLLLAMTSNYWPCGCVLVIFPDLAAAGETVQHSLFIKTLFLPRLLGYHCFWSFSYCTSCCPSASFPSSSWSPAGEVLRAWCFRHHRSRSHWPFALQLWLPSPTPNLCFQLPPQYVHLDD